MDGVDELFLITGETTRTHAHCFAKAKLDTSDLLRNLCLGQVGLKAREPTYKYIYIYIYEEETQTKPIKEC